MLWPRYSLPIDYYTAFVQLRVRTLVFEEDPPEKSMIPPSLPVPTADTANIHDHFFSLIWELSSDSFSFWC